MVRDKLTNREHKKEKRRQEREKRRIEQERRDKVIEKYIGLHWHSFTVIGKGMERCTAKCLCKCGTVFEIPYTKLRSGSYKNCGCGIRESEEYEKSVLRISSILNGMKERCNCKTDHNYRLYGGRGIRVCEEWCESKLFFVNWALSHGYKPNLSIDRINHNGNYEPENCQWADAKTQANNRRNNTYIFGEPIAKFCESRDISQAYIRKLMRCGLTEEEAVDKALKTEREIPPLEPWDQMPTILTYTDVIKLYVEV